MKVEYFLCVLLTLVLCEVKEFAEMSEEDRIAFERHDISFEPTNNMPSKNLNTIHDVSWFQRNIVSSLKDFRDGVIEFKDFYKRGIFHRTHTIRSLFSHRDNSDGRFNNRQESLADRIGQPKLFKRYNNWLRSKSKIIRNLQDHTPRDSWIYKLE